jgi:NADH-quinone oxidoreductase subunit N
MSDILQLSPYYGLLPELVLVLGAMALLMVGASVGQSSTDFVTGCAIFLLLVVCLLVAEMPAEKLVLFNGSFVLDGFGRYMKILSLIGSGATILMSIGFLEFPSRRTYEYVVLILLATAGGIGLTFGLVFLFAGLCFKVSAVPFHMWTPDVYEGAPTPITTFFASAPKVAAMAIFLRVALTAFPAIALQWQQIISFVAVASVLLGSFAAIGQTNIKRLMAYSSIGHMGFALIGLAAGTSEGVQGVLVYVAIYVTMTLGAFACILAMRREGGPIETISDLAGLARTNGPMAFLFAMLLFSLAGVPPLAGFFAKFYVFLAAIKAGLYGLAVIGILGSVIGAYYYLSIVKVMYFDEPAPAFGPMRTELKLVLAVTGLFNLLFFAIPGPLVDAASAAAKSLF